MKVTCVSHTKIDEDYLTKLMTGAKDYEFVKGVQSPEGLITYCARVSSPNPENPEYSRLLRYCMKHGHWSVFEMADMTVEIETSRAIAAQILRHRSFCFQEFSQRYAKVKPTIEWSEARSQHPKNRQKSVDDMDNETKTWFENAQTQVMTTGFNLYQEAIDKGIAKECARFLLPLSTKTKLFMKGNLRSWVHYVMVRGDESTQKEHRLIAEEIRNIMIKKYPVIAEAAGWTGDDNGSQSKEVK